MSFFDDLGKTITNKSQDVAKKAKDITDVTRLNSQISSERKIIDNYYLEIGKLYYQRYQDVPEKGFEEYIEKIQKSEKNIEQWNKEIVRIKKLRKCVNCGADIPADALFCNVCGARNELSSAVSAQSSSEFCPKCGTAIGTDAVFCLNCGNRVR